MKERQKYKGYEVLKYDREGNLLVSYDSMHLAQLQERVSHKYLRTAIDTGNMLRGFIFKFGELHGAYGNRHNNNNNNNNSKPAPWENNGFFDIEQWGKAF